MQDCKHNKVHPNESIDLIDHNNTVSIDQENIDEISPVISIWHLRKTILIYAWPCIIELFLVSLISMVNLIMVGHLGASAISAVGITSQPVFISISVFQSFNIGATALVSRFIGSKKYEKAKLVAIQTLIISLFSGIILSALGFYFSRIIIRSMGAKDDIIAFADLYMKYMAVGMLFQAIPTAVASLLRGAGETKSPMVFNIVSNISNVILGYILIYGFWIIPSIGIKGAAIAPTVAKIIACIMSIYSIFTINLPISLSLKDKFYLDFPMLKRIMRIGGAAAGEQFVLRTGLLLFTKIVADLGTIPFAAHQICINILGLSFNIGHALGISATSFVGRSLGKNLKNLAEIYIKEIRKIGMVVSILISICFFLIGTVFVGFYTNDKSVIIISSQVLKIMAVIIPAQTSQLIISGGLRGAGDTRWPLISTMSGILGFRIILGVLFVKVFSWGLNGAWVAVAIDQLVRSFVIYCRYKCGNWQYIKV